MIDPNAMVPVPEQWRNRGISAQRRAAMYAQSLDNPDAFWGAIGRETLDWITPFTQVSDIRIAPGDVSIAWFADGTLNACVNCVDRHLPTRADKPAIVWEGDAPGDTQTLTYRDVHEQVCRLANVLRAHGVGRGDKVAIYMPMIPLAACAMLACARIGAAHTVIFGGFSPNAIAGRINDCDAKVVITADAGPRGGRLTPLKANVDAALAQAPGVRHVFVLRHTGTEVAWHEGRDIDLGAAMATASPTCAAETMNAEDPLFILYTSGSTGTPKGVVHTTGGYLAYAAFTHKALFDVQDGELFWCTADVGWITGHTYVVYGPLANGCASMMFEGVPNWPDFSRVWHVCDAHKVTHFYTAPTAIRALMREGDAPVRATKRTSLKLLGTVGEPINPEAWRWFSEVVGEGRCPIVDTWWQTETGAAALAPIPSATPTKPGSATLPMFGIRPLLLDAQGKRLEGATSGLLCLEGSWPGQMRTIQGDHARFIETYYARFPGLYFTGDGARRDEDGYYWITGRVDDVINVSGHRIGAAEVESALVAHPDVAEAAVVSVPHEVKGEGIYAFVTLCVGVEETDALRADVIRQVRETIGPLASPDTIQWAPVLPKTRSGKIMRRILRKVAQGDTQDLGDTSTLADPSAVDALLARRKPI